LNIILNLFYLFPGWS